MNSCWLVVMFDVARDSSHRKPQTCGDLRQFRCWCCSFSRLSPSFGCWLCLRNLMSTVDPPHSPPPLPKTAPFTFRLRPCSYRSIIDSSVFLRKGGQMYLVLESQRPATGLRTPKFPKVPGRVLGRVPGKRGLLGGLLGAVPGGRFLWKKQRNGTAPSSPPSSPLFPGTLPSTLPGTFGDLGVLSPVAGRWDSKSSVC